MLIGIIGDIHGNIDALNATMAYFDQLAISKIYCAGDIVGYGAAPRECIETMISKNIQCVCGNHDFYTAFPDKYDKHTVREEANKVISWNLSVLSKEHKEWLASLPMSIDTGDFTITHASCQPAPIWSYILSTRSSAMNFLFQPRKLCFTAHSHVPVIATHVPGRAVTLHVLNNTILRPERMVMVGVGAVGQPRDGDPRACAVLYDTARRQISVLRIKYDIQAAQQRILNNSLPVFLAERLSRGQ